MKVMMAKHEDLEPSPDPELARRFGLSTATALIVGEVIGVGIFLTPARMAKQLGSPLLLALVWIVMGASSIGGALCFGALASRYPRAGGGYVYLKHAYGPRMAFLYGWLALLVTDPGVTAAMASGLADYVGYFAPLSPWGKRGTAAMAIIAVALVNLAGAALSSGVLRALAALKLGSLGFLVAWGFTMGSGQWSNLALSTERGPGADPLIPALAGALIAAFISYGGWWDAGKLAGETKDPGRTIPRALLLGVSIVTVVYLALSAVFLYLVPPGRITSDQGFAALAGEALLGRAGGDTFAAIVIVALLGSLAAVFMAFPRVYYAMAKDGLFFTSMAMVNPRTGVPARAVTLQATLAVALVLSGSFDQILNYFMAPTLVFLALTAGAVFVLRKESPGIPPLGIPGYPITPLVFLIPTILLVVALVVGDPWRSLVGLLVVAAGVPVSAWVVLRRAAAEARDASIAPPSP